MLFVLQGPQQGAVFPLVQKQSVVGRGESADIRLRDDGVSRDHARVTFEGDAVYVEDLQSRNGTFVRGERITSKIALEEGDYVQLGNNTVCKFARMGALEERALAELFESTLRDPLTRLYNRRYFDERLLSEFSFAQRQEARLSLLLIDIDRFKSINDTFGHPAGDVVLRIVAAALQKLMRPEDVLARYGGEEFIVIARGLSHRNAIILGERLRRRIAELWVPLPDGDVSVTVSIGVAQMGPDRAFSAPQGLVQAADRALYDAKRSGRNRVCAAS